LFYRYVRLISLNEVGGDPDHFGLPVEAFHAANRARARDWPHAMTATATHDTKRGEDARARLNALSEMPDDWARALDAWHEIAIDHLTEIDGEAAPDANDRVMILQSILGAWPLDLMESEDAAALSGFGSRIGAWAEKALREAKRYTSWVNEDADYERATARLIGAVLTPGSAFLAEFRPLAAKLARIGALNALLRTALKCTLPGVPDIYQGTEFWDFSLVDPDNRRPVDYSARIEALDDADFADLLDDWRSGRIKQHMLARLLADRAAAPGLYARGDYVPLAASGEKAEHVLAFTRSHDGGTHAVIVPRLVSHLISEDGLAFAQGVWGDTALALPSGRWRDVLTGRDIAVGQAPEPVEAFLKDVPAAILRKLGG
jgi:(1->4)-alpha-D-glucan 1-alpha-D-glucosylmutase